MLAEIGSYYRTEFIAKKSEHLKQAKKQPAKKIVEKVNTFVHENFSEVLRKLFYEIKGKEYVKDPDYSRLLVGVCSNIVSYVHEEGINNILLIDRAARVAYIGILQAWRRKYPGSTPPEIYSVNPDWFKNNEITYSNAEDPLWRRALMYRNNESDESGSFGNRPKEKAQQEFEETYTRLVGQKEQPLLVFDTCVHKGDTAIATVLSLKNWGFTHIKFGTVHNELNFSLIKPDFIAFDGLLNCRPFGGNLGKDDRLYEKSSSSVISKSTTNPEDRKDAIKLRKQIKRIFRKAPDKWFTMNSWRAISSYQYF